MTRLSLTKTALAGAALAALCAGTACRGGGGDDTDGGGNDSVTGDMRIQDVQNDAMAAGTAVTLKGVVVVAIDSYGGRRGNFYVMEPEGGEYSGILVYGAPLDQVAALAVGDLVDISDAEKDEFSLSDDDATVTELVPISGGQMTVTRAGTGTVPAPHVVDSLTFGRMDKTAREAEYEKWEGVLIRVDNVSVISGLRQIGSSDPTFRGFAVTGLYEVDSSLADIPVDHVLRDDCLMSVTGMGDYFYEYKVLPRETADIVKNGTSCPPPEADATTCDDGIDNEADGFIDCLDFSCQQVPICQTSTTITNVQQNGLTGVALLTGVTVTGRDTFTSSLQGLWVADAAQAAPYNGVYVFTGSTAPDPAWVEGALVDITGTVTEYDSEITEITNATITTAGTGSTPVALTGVSAATLADLTGGEPYEGVLVQLSNMKVMDNAMANNRVVLQDNSGATIIVDDDAFPYAPATDFPMNACLGSITGLMHWNSFDNHRSLVPRKLGDIVATGGTCN